MRTLTLGFAMLTALAATITGAMAQSAGPVDCVTIGVPKPGLMFTYEHTEASGARVRRTEQWDSVTPTGSRVRTTGPRGNETQVSEHRVVDDVTMIDRHSKVGPSGSTLESTTFRPAMVGDMAFRACAGKSWSIPSVTASYRSGANTASAVSPSGSLKIVSIHEKITVQAGSFDTVHYIRTSQSRDEYWKSIEHGVIVKHVTTLGAAVITDVLASIK